MNENAKKWVKALRSGEYCQTEGCLQDTDGYCCLGVACDVYQKETGEILKNDNGMYQGAVLDYSYVEVAVWLGLSTTDGTYNKDASLVEDNDSGRTFLEISSTIESEPEGLFNELG